MQGKRKNICIVAPLAFLLFGLTVAGILKPDAAYSETERRVLRGFPEVSGERLDSGKFMSEFEEYAQDQFPGRELFLKVKANGMRYLFGQKDNDGLYKAGGYLAKLEYPMNEARLNRSMTVQQELYDSYLENTDCRIYMALIPDKNYYLAPEYGYPTMDYGEYVETVKANTSYATYIDLFDTLNLDCYYRTDPHWRQECLLPVAEVLKRGMNLSGTSQYDVVELPDPFYGAYYDQVGLCAEPDTLCYLTSETLESCVVTSFDTGTAKEAFLYDMEKAGGRDPYEMFLSGSDALLVVENPGAETDRELVIFRDSFGSSLAPLLVEDYSKITLVDLRYMRSEALEEFVEFQNQDVLFLYSTLIY